MKETQRRFSLLDLILLVAAFAVGFALLIERRRQWESFGMLADLDASFVYWYGAGLFVSVGTYYAGLVTMCRRPTSELICRSPGRAAILAICCVSAISPFVRWDWPFTSALPIPTTLLYLPFDIVSVPMVAATAAFSVCAGTMLASAPRDPPDWIDRSGRILSFLWLVLAVAQAGINE